MVYYEHDYRSKKEIEADRERHISNMFHSYEKQIKDLTTENAMLLEQISTLHALLKETDSEYGKYLKLKDMYGKL